MAGTSPAMTNKGAAGATENYFTAEKAVGARIWLWILATIGPSASV